MSQMSNPYNHRYGQPSLFYGREQIAEDVLIHLLRRNTSFGICGGPKMGKTTLLRYIEQELFKRTVQEMRGGVLILPIYIDCHKFYSSHSLGEVYHFIFDQLRERFERKNESLPSFIQETDDINILKKYLLFIVNSQTTYRAHLIFLFDDINLLVNSEWGFDFFANWNVLLTKTPLLSTSLNAVFAGTSELYRVTKDVGSPLSHVLTWKELELFSIQETARLMKEPFNYKWSDEFIQEVHNLTGGHPFLIQYIMEIVCEQVSENPYQALKHAKLKFFNKQSILFQNWWDEFDEKTKAIYSRLVSQDSIKREVLFAEFGYLAQRAIDILTHTGIVKIDLSSNTVGIAGSLFKDWYKQFAFLPTPVDAFARIYSSPTKKGERDMNILELLTTTTIPAAVKFVFDQLGKLADRLTEKQLNKIEETKRKIHELQENEDVTSIRVTISDLFNTLPDNVNLDSKLSFKSWVHHQVTADYADLPSVGELLYGILTQKRQNETNEAKKDELLRMATGLIEASKDLRSHIRTGDDVKGESRELHKRIVKAVDLL